MLRTTAALVAFLLLSCQTAVYAQNSNAEQQEKDQEQKQRIYGTKHPWENTAPYGTQYTPPQAGGDAAAPTEPEAKEKPAAKPAAKPAPKHTAVKHVKAKPKTRKKK